MKSVRDILNPDGTINFALAIKDDGTIDPDVGKQLLDAATELSAAKAEEREAAHAAFHGREKVRYGRVETRRGPYARKGYTTCLDCYYGREWPG